MAATRAYVSVLIVGMIATGSSNSLWSKWQDMQCVENCNDPNPRHHVLYEQPVWQTLQMFLGEMLCFLPVLYSLASARFRRPAVELPADPGSDDDLAPEHATSKTAHSTPKPLQGFSVLLLWLPAACDLIGTTLMNVGLLYSPVSIYQMTRGAVVLFVGVLSVIFLHRRLWFYQWLSLLTVMLGVCIVGLAGSMIKDSVKETALGVLHTISAPLLGRRAADLPSPEPIEEPEATTVLLGVFFTLFAQLFTATQFVVEEKIMSRYSVAPLVAVGFEGLFGALTIFIFMPVIAQLGDQSPFFDLPRGWHQMINNAAVLWSGIAIAFSISLFNFFGLSVTRHVSATARSLTDTCRTLSIWIISLFLGWERLLWPISVLQILGFSLLVYGTFLFNSLVNPPKWIMPREPGLEERALLAEEALEETATLPADVGTGGYDAVPPRHAQSQTTDDRA